MRCYWMRCGNRILGAAEGRGNLKKIMTTKDIETMAAALRMLAVEIQFPDTVPAQCLRDAADMIENVFARCSTVENALKVLKADVDHLGHWIPDPCRKLVDDALNCCKSPELCLLSETCVPCAICPKSALWHLPTLKLPMQNDHS